MKKLAVFCLALLLIGTIATSCRSKKVDCPAYGSVKPVESQSQAS